MNDRVVDAPKYTLQQHVETGMTNSSTAAKSRAYATLVMICRVRIFELGRDVKITSVTLVTTSVLATWSVLLFDLPNDLLSGNLPLFPKVVYHHSLW